MARLRLKYDLANGPFLMANDDAGIPSNEAPDADVLNIGLTAYPILMTESGNTVNVRTEASHTSGDVRGIYNRLALKGAGGDGDALRAFTKVEAAIGSAARGAHISLSFGAAGDAALGIATALTATLHMPNTGAPNGNVAAVQAEAYMDAGDDDDVTVPTEHGVIRAGVSGDAGTAASFLNLLHVVTPAQCVGNKAALLMVGNADITAGGACTGGLQVRVNGTQYWLPLYSI